MTYFLPVFAGEPPVALPPGIAVCQAGTHGVTGIPGFGPNGLPALYARYRASIGEKELDFAVWGVSEPVILDARAWFQAKGSPSSKGSGPVLYESVTGTARPLVGFFADLPVRENPAVAERWFFMLEFGVEASRDERIQIAQALARSGPQAFAACRRVEDLSFPATITLFNGVKKM